MTINYDAAIEQLFDKLERKSHRRRLTVRPNLKVLGVTFNTVGIVGTLVGMVGMVEMASRDPVIAMASAGGCGLALGLIMLPAWEKGYKRVVSAGLGLVGRAMPLHVDHLNEITRWAKAHPRLVPILGKWTTQNPDGLLNDTDYRVVQKTMTRVSALQMASFEASLQRRAFEESGVDLAARRHLLTEVAKDAASTKTASSTPPRAM